MFYLFKFAYSYSRSDQNNIAVCFGSSYHHFVLYTFRCYIVIVIIKSSICIKNAVDFYTVVKPYLMNSFSRINETLCTICYHVYNFKNVKSTHGGVLLLVMLLTKTCNFTKVTLLYGCFPRFLNCTDGRKLRKVSQMNQGSFAGIASNIFMKRPESHCNLSSLYDFYIPM